MFSALLRRPVVACVILGGVAYGAVVGGSWAADHYRTMVTPHTGQLAQVRSVWAPLYDGAPLPPVSGAGGSAAAQMTPDMPTPPVVSVPTLIPTPAPIGHISLDVGGVPVAGPGPQLSFAWTAAGPTRVSVTWDGLPHGACATFVASDGPSTYSVPHCQSTAPFAFNGAAPDTAPPGTTMHYSITVTAQ